MNRKECNHPLDRYIKKGRGNLRCVKCDADITLQLILLTDMEKETKRLGISITPPNNAKN